MSVDEDDACNSPCTPVSCRGVDCTPPGENRVVEVCLVTNVLKSTRVFL